ncbi:hypothetical protein Hanom_Chr07g00661561 [Helianthus anomalus]
MNSNLRDEQIEYWVPVSVPAFIKSGVFSVSVRHWYSPILTLKYRCRTSTDRYRAVPYQVYSYRYTLLGISITVFSVPVGTELIYRCRTSTDRYSTRCIRYRYTLLGISITVFSVPVGTELIKSCSNVAMQVIAPFRLLFIHTVSKLYFV